MVQEHDPYGEMLEGAKDSTRPSLPGDDSRKKEEAAKKREDTESAKSELQEAESNAGGGFYKNGASAKEREESAGGFRTSVGGKSGKKKGLLGGRSKLAKASAGIGIFLIVLFAVPMITFGSHVFQIGSFDFNLMRSIGFSRRIGILEKVATFVLGSDLEEGKVSDQFAGKLAEQGLTVGQVTAKGDFVRTNTYIANAENLKDLAVLGNFQNTPSEGELAVLFDNKVVEAKDFVAALESDPKMYMAFLDAADIGAAYWYSNEMNEELKKIDVAYLRSSFADWEPSGDSEKDREAYEERKKDLLNKGLDLTVSGVAGGDSDDEASEAEDDSNVNSQTVSGRDDAGTVLGDVADQMEGGSESAANTKAVQALNAVMSANESYLAAKAFMFTESILQQTRIEGDAPTAELMTDLYKNKKSSYMDALAAETVETNGSILSSMTMSATLGGGGFSKTEASSLSRDRGVITMNSGGAMAANSQARLTAMVGKDDIKSTVISTEEKKSDVMVGISFGAKANKDALKNLTDGIDKTVVQDNSDLFIGIEGGNRIPGGAEFIMNMVDSHLIGAVSSSEEKVAEYYREAEEMVARRAEAERATKSPFDVSSPYTFMGSLVRSMGSTMLKSRVGNGGVVGTTVGVVANMTNDSMKSFYNTAIADGDDGSYELAVGDYCETPSVAGASSSVLCGPKYTLITEYMDFSDKKLEKQLKEGGNLDDDGNIKDKSGLGTFVAVQGSRQSTVGIQDAGVCEAYKNNNDSFVQDALDVLAGVFGRYKACKKIPDVATGANYTAGSDKAEGDLELYAAYVMRSEVKSLLDGTESSVSKFKKKYFEEHPLDNSREGVLARRSGLAKDEVKLALAYADYLTFIAKYNPAERYAFGVNLMPPVSQEPLVEHASQVAVDLYVMWHGRVEYDDLRTRTRVA